MKEHVSVWYESFDGKRFETDDECMTYELNNAYKKSGVQLYTEDMKLIENLKIYADDEGRDSYDCTEYVVIDRSKEEENRIFGNLVRQYCGWCLIEEAVKANGTKYKLDYMEIREID